MRKNTILAGIVGTLLVGLSQSAWAITVGTYSLNVGATDEPNAPLSSIKNGAFSSAFPSAGASVGGTYSGTYPGSAYATATASAGVDPGVSVTCTTSNTPGVSVYSSSANASLQFYFQVTGTGYAQIDLTGNYTQSLANAAYEDAAYVAVLDSANNATEYFFANNGTYNYESKDLYGTVYNAGNGSLSSTPSVNFSVSTWVFTNRLYSVKLSAKVSALNGFSPNSESIDPLVALDPSYLASNPGTTIAFSDGFADVPEPSSTLVLGVGALMFLSRRKKMPVA